MPKSLILIILDILLHALIMIQNIHLYLIKFNSTYLIWCALLRWNSNWIQLCENKRFGPLDGSEWSPFGIPFRDGLPPHRLDLLWYTWWNFNLTVLDSLVSHLEYFTMLNFECLSMPYPSISSTVFTYFPFLSNFQALIWKSWSLQILNNFYASSRNVC